LGKIITYAEFMNKDTLAKYNKENIIIMMIIINNDSCTLETT